MKYEIDDFAFIGRTLAEYQRMFDMDTAAWSGQRVLDCPAGPCSFVAEAQKHGIDAVGADVMYDRSPGTLAQVSTADINRAVAAFDGIEDLFRWDFYQNVSDLTVYRERAASQFLRDYAHNGTRYTHVELPELPFSDEAFDLVLSAHFLFLYDDRLSLEFHLETARELLRVGEQLRVFPLHSFDGERSELVASIVKELQSDHCDTEVREVPFEFQRGADTMLVVR